MIETNYCYRCGIKKYLSELELVTEGGYKGKYRCLDCKKPSELRRIKP